MLEFAGKQIPDTLEEIAAPGRTALLLWDMQNAIAPNAFNYKEVVDKLQTLTRAARAIRVPVFYAQQTTFDFATEETAVWIRLRMKRVGATAVANVARTAEGTTGWNIVDGLKPEAGDYVFRKRRPNGFEGTDLDLALRNRGIGTVLVAGVSTEGGVEVTSRAGLNLGYYIVLLSDCVGSRKPEMRDLAIEFMRKTHLDIATSDEVIACWEKARRAL
jgi:nicotinamidase-related amidase